MSDSNVSPPEPEGATVSVGEQARPPDDEIKYAVEVWKQIVAVQMHFNDIEMRIRNLYVTVLLAVVAAIGWVVDKRLSLQLGSLSIHYAFALLIAGLLSSYLFYLMDRYWYHQLLKGSVDKGKKLDEYYGKHIRAMGLTSQISGASPIASFRKTKTGWLLAQLRVISPPRTGEEPDDLHSTGKIELFYKMPIRCIQLFILLSLLFGGLKYDSNSIFDKLASLVARTLADC